jgi:NF-X1-type zinc finger protein NFXL1
VQEGVERVKEHLLSATGQAASCMICLEGIRPEDPVWSCRDSCYAVVHLPCIQVGKAVGRRQCCMLPSCQF